MTAIYSNSYITLAAVMSDGPESGIYTKGERYHGIMQTLAHFTRDGVNIPILARRAHQHDDFPLRQRGWVFQERLLSPRTIVFAREEIIWECQENEDCECGERFHEWRALLPIQSSREDREETIESWRSVVLQYSTLDLTFSHDALPALSGIAQVFAKVFDDKYLAGLGKKTIVAGLLWYRTDGKHLPGLGFPSSSVVALSTSLTWVQAWLKFWKLWLRELVKIPTEKWPRVFSR
jgi:hypothetical protein